MLHNTYVPFSHARFLAAIFPSTKVVHDSAKHNCHVWEKIYKELLRRNLPLNMGVFQSLVVAKFLENNDILALENDDALTPEIVEVLTPEIADDDLSSHDVDIEVDPAMWNSLNSCVSADVIATPSILLRYFC